jgi:hypothetical protein
MSVLHAIARRVHVVTSRERPRRGRVWWAGAGAEIPLGVIAAIEEREAG